MLQPTLGEFKEILLGQSPESVVKQYIFGGEPYAFRGWPEGLQTLRKHLCVALRIVDQQNVTVVGSGKLGFSLNPHNFGRQFTEECDIDILVVDGRLFDGVWQILLKWNYPRRYHLGGMDWEWGKKRMDDIYWGWLSPDKIRFQGLSFPDALKPLRDLSTRWFNAFRSLAQVPGFVGRDVSGRLYRTWEHALLYHVEGLNKITESIKQTEVG